MFVSAKAAAQSALLVCAALLLAPAACRKAGSDAAASDNSVAAPTASVSALAADAGKNDAVLAPSAAGEGNSVAAVTLKPIAWPHLGFVNNPGGKAGKTVALSFDDGPDGLGSAEGANGRSNMSYMLDQLDTLNLKATFFLCGNMWSKVLTDASAQADLKRMLAAGHHFGSHTYSHQNLDVNTISVAEAAEEFKQNQAVFSNDKALGAAASPFTMWRAPYGIPFQDGTGVIFPPTAASMRADVTGIAAASPANAVHIGWSIDTKDWECAANNDDSNCILKNLNMFLDKGASGVVLMHTVYALSAKTLPQVVQAIYQHNYRIVMVEDYIRDKYGGSSADIARANASTTFDAETLNNAALEAAMQSKWVVGSHED